MPVITKPKVPISDKPTGVRDSCLLLGYLSLIIQAFLGLVILLALVTKRLREKPKRKMQIFMYDITKQLTGSVAVHFINLLLSILLSTDEPEISINSETCTKIKNITLIRRIFQKFVYVYFYGDMSTRDDDDGEDDKTQCSWYFLNLLSDCTIGVYLLYFIIGRVNNIFKRKFKFQNTESGNYWELKIDKRLVRLNRFKDTDYNSIISINGKIIKDKALLEAIPEKYKEGYNIKLSGPKFKILLVQTMIFVISLVIMKLIISILLEIDFIGGILFHMTDEILEFLSKLFKSADIFFVMFVAPLCLNIFQYICIDSIIKLKPNFKHTETNKLLEDSEEDLNNNFRYLIDKVSYEHFNESVPLLP
ncbi:hypothetical protein FOG51_00702 [Hanseniaspora uvarum]|uniref:Vacuolar membrane protein n=1 Tax=Hanseniaspora uvarum TaxID=29833 RepID=A0A1E5RIJ0_HANUV|nr:hypothetical protein FOG48_01724 [Hanseniaspora uvarum]KAF0274328.1 hypothetical protein FOG51_00702 [Hanseniaspora uvarum]KAF0276471.1 hypothetical protein FOG50_02692 [Hanseniaspora uvarum]KKA01323.1 hypothetical protein D499_0AH00430 [Hanseniaspora uvarum DSM 2768]OEJ86707.1 Vacuolar membrane protein [Hanseniaspora uvarum]